MQLSKASKKNLESCVHKKKAEICMLMSLVHICIMFYQSVFFLSLAKMDLLFLPGHNYWTTS